MNSLDYLRSRLLFPPKASDFPTTVLGGGSVTDGRQSLIFRANALGASFNVQQILQPIPSAPFTKVWIQAMPWQQKQYVMGGLCLKNNGSGAFQTYFQQAASGLGWWLEYSTFSDPTTRTATGTDWSFYDSYICCKFQDDGANWILSASATAEAGSWMVVSSRARTAGMTHIGFATNAYNAGAPLRDAVLNVFHWGETDL
jgi:hypothetical protein